MRALDTAVTRDACIALLLLVPLTGLAHTLEAPQTVRAQLDGSFTYEWVFKAGPGSVVVAAFGWSGVDNVEGGLVSDCFCDPGCVLHEGESIVETVSGMLTDPTRRGVVRNWVAPCAGPEFQVPTKIETATPVEEAPLHDGEVVRLWNRPNPFARETMFYYALPESGPVELRIYDVAGRLVATPLNEVQSAGLHSVTWEARGAGAAPLTRGVYLARIHVNGVVRTRRLVIVD